MKCPLPSGARETVTANEVCKEFPAAARVQRAMTYQQVIDARSGRHVDLAQGGRRLRRLPESRRWRAAMSESAVLAVACRRPALVTGPRGRGPGSGRCSSPLRYQELQRPPLLRQRPRDHGVTLVAIRSCSSPCRRLGLVPKGRARARHRRRREPRPCVGELLHLDGSDHEWLAGCPGQRQMLLAVLDDATKRLLYAQLWPAETTHAVLMALRAVLTGYGMPMALYTDRAGWAFHTPTAGGPVDRTHLTVVGRILACLGIDHIPSYSPQARGRVERLNRTLQGRLVERAPRRRDHDARGRERLPARAFHRRLQPRVHPPAGRSRQCVRPPRRGAWTSISCSPRTASGSSGATMS